MTKKEVKLFDHYLPLYYWNKKSDKPIRVNQGGSSAGKTIAILQLIITMCIEKPDLLATITSQDTPNLKSGALRDFKNLIKKSELLASLLVNPNLDMGPFKFRNGSQVEFKAFESEQDARGGRRDILFINEANAIEYEVAQQLMMRTNIVTFIDYNPSNRFWVHRELIGNNDVDFFVSNFMMNTTLPENIKNQLFKFKDNYEKTGLKKWENKWRVYGLGLTGIVEGTIFEDVDMCALLPTNLIKQGYGLDFGFKNNYTALIKAGIGPYDGRIYGKEIIYEQGLNVNKLAIKLKRMGFTKRDPIVADSANVESIAILNDAGLNIIPAKKGNGSVRAGIDTIQDMGVTLTADSHNWFKEQENYIYKKVNGNFTNDPIDTDNDAWSALRYYVEEMVGFRQLDGVAFKNRGKKFTRKVLSF